MDRYAMGFGCDAMNRAYADGWIAARGGGALGKCPYLPPSLADAWRIGWHWAEISKAMMRPVQEPPPEWSRLHLACRGVQ